MPMVYKPKASSQKPPLLENDNAFLGDVLIGTAGPSRMCGGFYRQEKGTTLDYLYDYDEMKIIIDGTFHITDDAGTTVTATAGDVFFFPSGTRVQFSSPDFGLGWFVGRREPIPVKE